MQKKKQTQREKIASWIKTVAAHTTPEEFSDLVRDMPDPELLLGVNRVTLDRWRSGNSRIPFAAAQLLRLLRGTMPHYFGCFAGWRFLPSGEIYPPGWGEPILRQDVIDSWFYREQASHAADLETRALVLLKDNAFLREQTKTRAALGCAYATAEVLAEPIYHQKGK